MKKPRAHRDVPISRSLEVTAHAVKRYQERIDPACSKGAAITAILSARNTARRLESQDRYCTLYSVHGDAWRMVVRHAPTSPPAVITVLWTHETEGDPDLGDGPTDAELARETIAKAQAEADATAAQARFLRAAEDVVGAHKKRERERADREREAGERAARADLVNARIAVMRADIEARYASRIARLQALSDLENRAKMRAWKLLLLCAPHVPRELCIAIDDALPTTWVLTQKEPQSARDGGEPQNG
jgi:hypothetical protein